MLTIILKTIVYAVISFFVVLFSIRLLGRKTLSRMTLFDFILGVSLGALTALFAIGPRYKEVGTTLVVFVALTFLLDVLHLKSFFLRRLINSEPVEIIKNGVIIDHNLKKMRHTIDELHMLLRQKGFFNIADVEFAILEINGQLSVLPKSQKQPLTPSDLGVSTGYVGLMKDLIMDGTIFHENLRSINLDENWLMENLHKQGINEVGNVFYAGLDSSGNLYLSLKRRLD